MSCCPSPSSSGKSPANESATRSPRPTPADEFVDEDVLLLADAEGAVGRLVLDRRVPPEVEMHDMRRRREIKPRPAGLQRQNEKRNPLVLLEILNQRLAASDLRLAMQGQARPPENATQEGGERIDDLAKLGEPQHLFLAGGDHLGDLAQARPFAAIFFAPGLIGEPLRGMVADLLQPRVVSGSLTSAAPPAKKVNHEMAPERFS